MGFLLPRFLSGYATGRLDQPGPIASSVLRLDGRVYQVQEIIIYKCRCRTCNVRTSLKYMVPRSQRLAFNNSLNSSLSVGKTAAGKEDDPRGGSGP